MNTTQNSKEICRECLGDIDSYEICKECEERLQREIDSYPTVESLIESIDYDLIWDLAEANGVEWMIEDYGYDETFTNDAIYEQIAKGMKSYALENETNGMTRDLNSIKGDFLSYGHIGDDFREFYFYELFSEDELRQEYLI
ncbi:MAG: hypothetical protein K0S93_19 [Nitrososphaeraceae archaeon]|jgi:hypothetical protein|nr:hypothetical protein [Nitrososphaeraceae archaeon]